MRIKPHHRLALPGLLLAGLTLPLGAVSSAHATEAGPTGSSPRSGQHCTADVETGATTCFGTFREAIRHATGGALADAPVDARAAASDPIWSLRLNALTEPDGTPAPGVADVVLSISWQHPNRGGASLTHTASHGCDSDKGVEFSRYDLKVPSPWWNDRISSFKGYSRCQPNMYEHHGYRGARTGFHGTLMNMGGMEDKTTSIKWR